MNQEVNLIITGSPMRSRKNNLLEKGERFAVYQEPEDIFQINTGSMMELTGDDSTWRRVLCIPFPQVDPKVEPP